MRLRNSPRLLVHPRLFDRHKHPWVEVSMVFIGRRRPWISSDVAREVKLAEKRRWKWYW